MLQDFPHFLDKIGLNLSGLIGSYNIELLFFDRSKSIWYTIFSKWLLKNPHNCDNLLPNEEFETYQWVASFTNRFLE